MATRLLAPTVEQTLDDLPKTPHVYQAIAEVQGELATVGIAKTRRNTQGSGYNFRGIDDVYAALSPLLAKHKLVVVPRVTSREVVERQSKSGGALFYVTVHSEFDFVSAIDGTIHTAATFGEAMDSGDKATNKAMSAAYKYAAFMTFAIPTEGDNDADSQTHEVAVRSSGASISDEQFRNLQAAVDRTGADLSRFCAYFQVPSLKDVPAARYQDALNALEAKAKKASPVREQLEKSLESAK
jgi:hypothetical protein